MEHRYSIIAILFSTKVSFGENLSYTVTNTLVQIKDFLHNEHLKQFKYADYIN